MKSMKVYKFNALLQHFGWISPVYVGIGPNGVLAYLSENPPAESTAIESVKGFVLPGFQNAHSHAFQYAMAGMAERHPAGSMDNFWSWREAMYKCALGMSPDQVEATATMLYVELIRKGYTHVAEFHYLHNDKSGKSYSNRAEMGERLVAAAQTAGIKITLAPVLYQKGNFGEAPHTRQRRFISPTIDNYFDLLSDTEKVVGNNQNSRLGFGVHSLRAVDPSDIVSTYQQGPKNIPFHLHAAEQLKEVEDCMAYCDRRPIQWLLENMPVNDRFHIVHCTHMNDLEVTTLAKSGANVVLCPGTEGNLGDGIFRLSDFAREGGSWSIGTDSHISLNPLEDLRWLDYAQRLTTHRRNTFDNPGDVLISKALHAGRKAMNNYSSDNYFELNSPFDAVVFDAESPLLMNSDSTHLLSGILYTADSSNILGTLINGKWIVKRRIHNQEDRIKSRFIQTLKTLASE